MDINEGLSLVPDQESSTQAYASRFSGNVGSWLLDVQDAATRKCLQGLAGLQGGYGSPGSPGLQGVTLLEPGGAHGQNVSVLGEMGVKHHILSSPGCTREMLSAALAAGRVTVEEGSFTTFPAADKSVDVVLSYRMLAHIQDWQIYVKEMCRVATKRVVVDYPTMRSFNVLTESLYHLKKGVESNTRPYRIFSEADLVAAFAAEGFRPVVRVGQFFFPMAVHRGLKQPGLSRLMEKVAGLLGLQYLFGSPVIAAFERSK